MTFTYLDKFSKCILLHFVHLCLVYNHVMLWKVKGQNMKTKNRCRDKKLTKCSRAQECSNYPSATLIGAIITCLHADKEGNMARER